MINTATFSVDDCNLRAPESQSSVTISLWLRGNQAEARAYPISGFPRTAMMEEFGRDQEPFGMRRWKSMPSVGASLDRGSAHQLRYSLDSTQLTQPSTGTLDLTSQAGNEEFQPVSPEPLHESYHQQNPSDSCTPATQTTKIESPSLGRSLPLPRVAATVPHDKAPRIDSFNSRRELGLAIDSSSDYQTESGQDKVAAWEYPNSPLEDVEDSPGEEEIND